MKYRTSQFSDQRVRRALEQAGVGIWEHNLATDEVVWNEQMHQIYGQEVINTAQMASIWVDSLHPDDRARAIAEFEQAAVGHLPYESHYRIVRQDGTIRHLRSKASYDVSEAGYPCYWGTEFDLGKLGPSCDPTAGTAPAQRQLGQPTTGADDLDPITSLPNRLRLYDTLQKSTESAQALAVVQIDLADFRNINEEFGYQTGDRLLQQAAAALSQLMSDNASLFRSGSSEFTIVVPEPTQSSLQHFSKDAIEAIHLAAKQIQPAMNGAAHIGLVHAPSPNFGPRLLALSEAALIQAKRRNIPIVFHDDALMADLVLQRLAKKDLKRAIELGEIEPFYQIQVDTRTGAIAGLEALARWRHPEKGILPPSTFLPAADANGLMGQIDDLILRRVLEDRQAWEKLGLTVPRTAVNVSAVRLSDERLVASLQKPGCDYSGIAFELVETVYFDGVGDETLASLNAIRSLGIEIEIDDFGSGHASLLSLLKIRPNRVKIDRHLIKDIVSLEQQRQVVQAIIEIANTLKIEVVAEGVETDEQASLLSHMGCTTLQGYLFGKPEASPETGIRLRGALELNCAEDASAS